MTNENVFWSRMKSTIDREKDLSVFKTWDTVRAIPVYRDNEFPVPYSAEVEYMLKHRSTEELTRWKECLKEPFLGHTEKSYSHAQLVICKDVPSTSWALKSAHHVLTGEALLGRSILSYDQIVEFGAGIGETARLITDLGFGGDYFIVDLPEMGRVSDYYLRGRVQVCDSVQEIPRRQNTLFIATWSLSEVPMDYRNAIVTFFKGADFLIIFQKRIFEYDNWHYFCHVFPSESDTSIRLHPIVWHRGGGGNWYLSATPRGKSLTARSGRGDEYVLPPLCKYQIRVTLHWLRRVPWAIRRRLA